MRASPAATWEAIRAADLTSSRTVRALLTIRGGPRRLGLTGLTVDGLGAAGFTELERRTGEEILYGLAGRFWRPSGGRLSLAAHDLRDFAEPGYAVAYWAIGVRPSGMGWSTLWTQTRVRWTDNVAERRFLRYWRIVGPFSGLIRRRMLDAIERRALEG